MVTRGDDCVVRLTAEGTGELFAECPVPKDQPLTTVLCLTCCLVEYIYMTQQFALLTYTRYCYIEVPGDSVAQKPAISQACS